VERVQGSNATVLYIDYGNKEVSLTSSNNWIYVYTKFIIKRILSPNCILSDKMRAELLSGGSQGNQWTN